MSEKMAETGMSVTESDIAEAAANPSSFSVDGLSQTNRSVTELITADKYLRKRSLMKRRAHPLSGLVSKIISPGPYDG